MEQATIRPATFDEAERWGFDGTGTIRPGATVYVVTLRDGTRLACESLRAKVVRAGEPGARLEGAADRLSRGPFTYADDVPGPAVPVCEIVDDDGEPFAWTRNPDDAVAVREALNLAR